MPPGTWLPSVGKHSSLELPFPLFKASINCCFPKSDSEESWTKWQDAIFSTEQELLHSHTRAPKYLCLIQIRERPPPARLPREPGGALINVAFDREPVVLYVASLEETLAGVSPRELVLTQLCWLGARLTGPASASPYQTVPRESPPVLPGCPPDPHLPPTGSFLA